MGNVLFLSSTSRLVTECRSRRHSPDYYWLVKTPVSLLRKGSTVVRLPSAEGTHSFLVTIITVFRNAQFLIQVVIHVLVFFSHVLLRLG